MLTLIIIGTVSIKSSDTNDLPIVNTGTLSDPVDFDIALGALKYMRSWFSTKSFSRINVPGGDVVPGEAVQTDAQMLEWLAANIGTGFHGTSTCQYCLST